MWDISFNQKNSFLLEIIFIISKKDPAIFDRVFSVEVQKSTKYL